MWWRDFTENPENLKFLPRNKIEKSFHLLENEMNRMTKLQSILEKELTEKSVQLCKLCSELLMKFYDDDRFRFGGDFHKEMVSSLHQKKIDLGLINEEIIMAEKVLRRLNSAQIEHRSETIDRILKFLVNLYISEEDLGTKEQYIMALELLTDECSYIKTKLNNSKNKTQMLYSELSIYLSTALKKALKSAQKTTNIFESLNMDEYQGYTITDHASTTSTLDTQIESTMHNIENMKTLVKQIQQEIHVLTSPENIKSLQLNDIILKISDEKQRLIQINLNQNENEFNQIQIKQMISGIQDEQKEMKLQIQRLKDEKVKRQSKKADPMRKRSIPKNEIEKYLQSFKNGFSLEAYNTKKTSFNSQENKCNLQKSRVDILKKINMQYDQEILSLENLIQTAQKEAGK